MSLTQISGDVVSANVIAQALTSNTVPGSVIVNNSITAQQIANSSITPTQISTVSNTQVIGAMTNIGYGVIGNVHIASGTVLPITNGGTGQTSYGTSGQFLTSQGPSVAPTWTSLVLNANTINSAVVGSQYAGLPSAYVAAINNRNPNYIYWVSTTGSDSTGTGTYANPWATPYKAVTNIPTGVNATLIIMPGTYTYTDQSAPTTTTSLTGMVLYDGWSTTSSIVTTRSILFVGYPNQTILNGTSVTSGQPSSNWRDYGGIALINPSSAAIGLIIKRNNGGRTNNYSVAFNGPDGVGQQAGTIMNCVFQETNANGYISNTYYNAGGNYQNWLNCTVITTVPSAYLASYSGGSFYAMNNISNDTTGNFTSNLSGYWNSNSFTFDSNYKPLTGNFKQNGAAGSTPFSEGAFEGGVWGGKYGWGNF
jgi:hypothetical protein